MGLLLYSEYDTENSSTRLRINVYANGGSYGHHLITPKGAVISDISSGGDDFVPIIAKQCVVEFIMGTSSSGAEHGEDIFYDLISSSDGDLFMEVLDVSHSKTLFYGPITVEATALEDRVKPVLRIKAIDGISKIKSIALSLEEDATEVSDQSNAVSPTSSGDRSVNSRNVVGVKQRYELYTIKDLLFAALSSLTDIVGSGHNDLVHMEFGWTPTGVSGSPLENLYLDAELFYVKGEDGTKVWDNCYTVVEKILHNLGMQIRYEEGAYRIKHLLKYAHYTAAYTLNGDAASYSSPPSAQIGLGIRKLAGTSKTLIVPYSRTVVVMPFITLYEGEAKEVDLDARTATSGDIYLPSGNLHLGVRIRMHLDPVPSTPDISLSSGSKWRLEWEYNKVVAEIILTEKPDDDGNTVGVDPLKVYGKIEYSQSRTGAWKEDGGQGLDGVDDFTVHSRVIPNNNYIQETYTNGFTVSFVLPPLSYKDVGWEDVVKAEASISFTLETGIQFKKPVPVLPDDRITRKVGDSGHVVESIEFFVTSSEGDTFEAIDVEKTYSSQGSKNIGGEKEVELLFDTLADYDTKSKIWFKHSDGEMYGLDSFTAGGKEYRLGGLYSYLLSTYYDQRMVQYNGILHKEKNHTSTEFPEVLQEGLRQYLAYQVSYETRARLYRGMWIQKSPLLPIVEINTGGVSRTPLSLMEPLPLVMEIYSEATRFKNKGPAGGIINIQPGGEETTQYQEQTELVVISDQTETITPEEVRLPSLDLVSTEINRLLQVYRNGNQLYYVQDMTRHSPRQFTLETDSTTEETSIKFSKHYPLEGGEDIRIVVKKLPAPVPPEDPQPTS